MKDSTLLNIALVSSFIGLCILFIMMYFSVIPEKTINSINDSDLGSKIKISGEIEQIRVSSNNKTTFITLSQKCSMTIISFDGVNLTKQQRISVEGILQEYENKKEIIVDKIIIQTKS